MPWVNSRRIPTLTFDTPLQLGAKPDTSYVYICTLPFEHNLSLLGIWDFSSFFFFGPLFTRFLRFNLAKIYFLRELSQLPPKYSLTE